MRLARTMKWGVAVVLVAVTLLVMPGDSPSEARAASLASPAGTLPAGLAEASAASLTGNWFVTIDGPEGELETAWELEQHEDGTLTGLTTSDMSGEAGIEGGWVDADTFGFDVFVEAQGQAFNVTYEGTFTDDEVSGTLDVEGGMFTTSFSGVRAEGAVR